MTTPPTLLKGIFYSVGMIAGAFDVIVFYCQKRRLQASIGIQFWAVFEVFSSQKRT